MFFFFTATASNCLVEVKLEGEDKPRHFTPEEISANILLTLKKAAELFLDDKVEGAVITVPAYFTDQQRYTTLQFD